MIGISGLLAVLIGYAPVIGGVGVFALLIGYAAVSGVAADRLSRARRRVPPGTPAKVGLAYENVGLLARGEALNLAAWYIPAAEATRAVIVVHGMHRCRGRELSAGSLELVDHFVSSGFAVLMLDLRGHGESDAARLTYGVRERRDVLGAVDWLLGRGFAPGAIGVLGASMGGVASIGAAAVEPAIGALVLDSAYADFFAMTRVQFAHMSKLPPWFLPGTLLLAQLLMREDIRRLRPADQLRSAVGLPVLVIHSESDPFVPVEHAYTLALAGDAELWVTAGTGHLSSYGADPHAYTERVVAFFDGALAREHILIASAAKELR